MASIHTIVDDIYRIVSDGTAVTEEDAKSLGTAVSSVVVETLSPEGRQAPRLRLSNLGEKCDRKLWLQINRPEVREDLSPETKLKFLIGHIHEAVLLFLAKVSGHVVEGQQDTILVGTVEGHRDAVIDGVLTDVKSATPMSFDKFEAGLTKDNDDFNYVAQLQSYMQGSGQDEGAFLVSDKTVGRITLDLHKRNDTDYTKIAEKKQAMLASPDLPNRAYMPSPDGKSGNLKLGTQCAYCDVKRTCWPGVRRFLYSNGIRYLTYVARLPEVPEVT